VTRLVGREAELAVVGERLAAARRARAGTVLVSGDAGMGKTRLLDELTTDLPDRVLRGSCLPIVHRGLPYLPLLELLRGLRPEERRFVPPALETLTAGGGGAALAVSRSQLFHAAVDLFERLASRRPLVLVIEDLHWADGSTLDLLDLLIGLLRDQRILLLATLRDDDPPPGTRLLHALGEWERRPGVERLRLSSREARGLVLARSEAPEPARSGRIVELAGGNPFFLEQLLAASERGEHVPRHLRDLLLSRTRALHTAVVHVLRVASVGGVTIDEALVARIAGRTVDEVRGSLREAAVMQLLTIDDGGCRFRHALLAEVLHADLLPAERREIHAAYAEALTERGDAASARLAVHHSEAGDAVTALSAWIAAATEAERLFAFTEARHGLEAAIALWPDVDVRDRPPGVTLDDLRRRLADAAFNAGDAVAASDLARALIDDLDPDEDPVAVAMLHHRLARYLCATPDHAQALGLQQRAVELVPAAPPSQRRAEVIAGLAQILEYEDRLEEARVHAEEAVGLARATGASHAEVAALNTLGAVLGQLDLDGAPLTRKALRLARRIHDAHEQARSLWNLSLGLGLEARWHEMLDTAEETTAALRRLRPGLVAGHLEALAAALCSLGRWDEATAVLDEARREDPSRADAIGNVELLVARGHLVRARKLQGARRASAIVQGAHEEWRLLVDDAVVEVADAHPERAVGLVAAVLDGVEGRHLPDLVGFACVTGLRAAADVVTDPRRSRDGAAREEALDIGRRCDDRLVALLDGPGRPDGWKRQGVARAAQGAAERSRLEGSSDPAMWEVAAARWEALGAVYQAAYCRFRWAEAEAARQERRGEVTAVLVGVLALLDELDEVQLATDVRELGRRARLGLEEGSGTAGVPAALGLTRREHEVLRRLATGVTNRQIADILFISERTVSVHVSRVLTKLQAATRGEATAIAVRDGLVDLGRPASPV
jgi:DNA-binding CsgD family transcriptional regulator/tetratricopeptide (TPR) repeat protein